MPIQTYEAADFVQRIKNAFAIQEKLIISKRDSEGR
jgi:hypothetical protein